MMGFQVRASETDREPYGGEWKQSRLGVLLDALSDAAVVALACWTVLAWIATATQAPIEPFIAAGLAVLAAAVAVAVRRSSFALRRRRAPLGAAPVVEPRSSGGAGPAAAHPQRLAAFAASAVLALISAMLAAQAPSESVFRLAWVAGALQLVLVSALLLRGGDLIGPPAPVARSAPRPGPVAERVVAAAGIGLGVFSLFLFRFSPDDIYYLNRAQWIADFGRIPYRDVLLANQQHPAVGGGSPVETFSALQGSLARLSQVPAGEVAYYVLPPIFTVLAVWALWRLMRAWAPRRPLVCLGAALAFLFVDAAHGLSFGSYFLPRFSQGKAVFVSWLVPTLYVYLTRWVRDGHRTSAALAAIAAVTGVGLTASAAFVVPLILLTAAVPLILQQRYRSVAVLAGAAAIALLAGYIGAQYAPPRGFQLRLTSPPLHAYTLFLDTGAVAVVGGLALWLGPWLVRDRVASLIVAGATVCAAVALAPQVTESLAPVVGVGAPLKRLLWVIPVPALAGLLVALPPPIPRTGWARTAARVAAGVVAAGLIAGLLVATHGNTIANNPQGRLTDHPVWRVPPGPLREAEQIAARSPDGAVVLAPAVAMHALAIRSVSVKAVDPRRLYTRLIPQPPGERRARLRLSRWVRGIRPISIDKVAVLLRRVRVGIVCAKPEQFGLLAGLQSLGWEESFTAEELTCFRGPVTAAPRHPTAAGGERRAGGQT
jgi:hypothetical protein